MQSDDPKLKELEEFLAAYGIHVLENESVIVEPLPMKLRHYLDFESDEKVPERFNKVPQRHTRAWVIRIPESKLEILAQLHNQIANSGSKIGAIMLKEYLELAAFERRLQNQHPIVKEAWEKYLQTLLLTADSTPPKKIER